MLRCRVCIAIVAALGFVLPGAVAAHADVLSASVSATPTGQEMAPGFVGASFEFRALHQYTGRDPRAVDPVLLSLLSGLAAGQPPVIRIGGDSTDGTWWPIRGQIPQNGIYYSLTKGWLRTTQALAADLNAKLILGVNLAAGRPAIAAAEGRAYMEGIGRKYIDALEIGNEPDLYPVFPWYRDRRGHIYRARGRGYGLSAYTKQFVQWARALPNLPLAGPAVSGPNWLGKLGSFIGAAPRLGMVTYHRYPLRACVTDPSSPGFPSIPNLLADSSSAGLATPMSPFISVAHRHNLDFRVAEMNSASCQGQKGVSDTFASALWALDTMFQVAKVGVDGVNFHMLPGSNYELFTISHNSTGAWQAFVHPEYYGLLAFAQAFPPGARLLETTGAGGAGSPLKVWATRGGDGAVRVTLINKDPTAEHDVSLTVSGATAAGSLETLRAPSIDATNGVTLGGQTFGDETTTGTLPDQTTTSVVPVAGAYTVPVPAGSAALLTIGGGGGGIGLTRTAAPVSK